MNKNVKYNLRSKSEEVVVNVDEREIKNLSFLHSTQVAGSSNAVFASTEDLNVSLEPQLDREISVNTSSEGSSVEQTILEQSRTPPEIAENYQSYIKSCENKNRENPKLVSIIRANLTQKNLNNQFSMANVTLRDVLQEERDPALPKFISPSTYNPSCGDILTFIQEYDRCALLNGWNNSCKLRFLRSYLLGAAEGWFLTYSSEEENANKNWDEVRNDLLVEFGGVSVKRELKARISARIQKENEDIKTYYFDLLELCRQLDPNLPKDTFREYFENGLHQMYHDKYFFVASDDMSSKDLKDLVFKLSDHRCRAKKSSNDQSMCSMQSTPAYNPNNTYNNIPSHPKNRQTYHKQTGANRRDEQPRTRTRDNKPICYNCNQVGHIARNCDRRQYNDRRQDDRRQYNESKQNDRGQYNDRRSGPQYDPNGRRQL